MVGWEHTGKGIHLYGLSRAECLQLDLMDRNKSITFILSPQPVSPGADKECCLPVLSLCTDILFSHQMEIILRGP